MKTRVAMAYVQSLYDGDGIDEVRLTLIKPNQILTSFTPDLSCEVTQ